MSLEQPARTLSTAERILSGAATVVARRGLRDSTVQEVLVAAGVSRRTFYLHYPSIEGVMCDLYIQRMGELVDAVSQAMAGLSDPRIRVQAAVGACVEFQAAAGPLLIHLQTEAARPGSMLSPVRERTLDRLVALLSDEQRGLTVSPLLLRGLLMGVEGLLHHLQRHGRSPTEAAPAARELVLDAIDGALRRQDGRRGTTG